jgi:multidrug resistance efflux pump
MTRYAVYKLEECSEFHTMLKGRPPVIAHAAMLSFFVLIASLVLWSAWVKANVVVAVNGRVRPLTSPAKAFAPQSQQLDGRIAEVMVQVGDQVSKDQVLLRLDSTKLENELGQRKLRSEAIRLELANLNELEMLTLAHLQSSQAKAAAELTVGRADVSNASQRRASLIGQRESELAIAEDHAKRARPLRASGAISDEEAVEAEGRLRQALEALNQAKLPLPAEQVDILEWNLKNVGTEQAMRSAELGSRKVAKQLELESLQREMDSLERERELSLIRSPIDGVVVMGSQRPGEILELGKPVFEVAGVEGFRFEARVPSRDAGLIAVGKPVRIRFNAYDYQLYGFLEGKIATIAPDSEAVDHEAITKPDPTYRVEIDLNTSELTRGSYQANVKLGLSGIAEVVVQRASLLEIFFRKLQGTVRMD